MQIIYGRWEIAYVNVFAGPMWVLVDVGAGAVVDVEGGWGGCGVVYDDVVGGGDGVDGKV